MKRVMLKVSIVTVIVVLILSIFAAAYFLWRPSQSPSLSGVCTVYDYYEADTVIVELTTVATTIRNTTTYYRAVTSVITPTPMLTSSSTFTSTAPSYITINDVIVRSTVGYPGKVWNVTVCTFAR